VGDHDPRDWDRRRRRWGLDWDRLVLVAFVTLQVVVVVALLVALLTFAVEVAK